MRDLQTLKQSKSLKSKALVISAKDTNLDLNFEVESIQRELDNLFDSEEYKKILEELEELANTPLTPLLMQFEDIG